ncbi:MAG: PIN domain-containing protein [Deltaproteobacteria bacterium]|nr:PIN domain-containing protein [Deltaproteobacteria bacterium]
MNILVDSSVLIDVLGGRGGRPVLLRRLLAEGSLLCSCDITLAEVYCGMRDREREVTEAFLGSLFYIPSDPETARQAGVLRRDWRVKGHSLALADTFLAALALRHGLLLLTDNVRHFPMRGLLVRRPEELRKASERR